MAIRNKIRDVLKDNLSIQFIPAFEGTQIKLIHSTGEHLSEFITGDSSDEEVCKSIEKLRNNLNRKCNK